MNNIINILYLEDDYCCQEYIRHQINKKLNWNITICDNVLTAIDMIGRNNYDFCLVDFNVPPIYNGSQLIARLKASGIPHVYYTAYDPSYVRKYDKNTHIIVKDHSKDICEEIQKYIEV